MQLAVTRSVVIAWSWLAKLVLLVDSDLALLIVLAISEIIAFNGKG
jgi:hypothetical protein